MPRPRRRRGKNLGKMFERVVREARPGWGLQIFYCHAAVEGDRSLVTIVGSLETKGAARYGATAIEAAAKPSTLAAVFAKHGHCVIGEHYRSADTAQRASEKYMRAWVKEQKRIAACKCKPIGSSRPGRSHRTGARAPRRAA